MPSTTTNAEKKLKHIQAQDRNLTLKINKEPRTRTKSDSKTKIKPDDRCKAQWFHMIWQGGRSRLRWESDPERRSASPS